jgi:hypothetical protein
VYVNGHRQQFVYGLAAPLTTSHVPPSWLASRIVHVGPVIGECHAELITGFPEDVFVGVTPQGWMRSRGAGGRVYPHPWRVSQAGLARASAVVFSLDDVLGDWDAALRVANRTHILAVTTGAQGGVLFVDGATVPFPALTVAEVDPTGAGDIFAAAFFSNLALGVAPSRATSFAACVASRSVARVGLMGVPGPDDIAFCESVVTAAS